MSEEKLLSQTISTLRFPLSVCVILIHAHLSGVVIGGTTVFSGSEFPVYATLSHCLSRVVANIAVPLFFFFSGYLFFRGTSFGPATYFSKLRRRARTILIPYIAWNLLFIGLSLLGSWLFPSLISGANKTAADFSLVDWADAFWSLHKSPDAISGAPVDYPLWFLRDLMVVMVFSPLVYVFVKRLGVFGLFILGTTWFFVLIDSCPGFSTAALFFFSAGAWYALRGRNFVSDMRPLLLPAGLLYAALIAGSVVFKATAAERYIYPLSILVGMVFAIAATAALLRRRSRPLPALLPQSSFFLFAYHWLPLALFQKLSVKLFQPTSDLATVTIYLGTTTATVLLGLGLYYLLRRRFPFLLPLFTGGR